MQVVDDSSRKTCTQKFDNINTLLNEAAMLAEKLGNEDLLSQIDERRERAQELSKKCQPEVSMKVLATRVNDTQVTIDVQVFTGSGSTKAYKPNMAGSLQVWNDATLVEANDVQITEKSADDKVCLIFLADSSGSIKTNQLDDIRAAVDTLNDVRKRGDYFGIVTFGGRNEIKNGGLQSDILDRSVINNSGGNTAIWDATVVALDEMKANCGDTTERYVLLMTDGKDNHSVYMDQSTPAEKANSLHDRAVAESVQLCVVGVSEDVKQQGNDEALKKLSTECGYRYVDEFSGLAAEFQGLFGYDREYYRISVNASAVDGARELTLRILGTDSKLPVSIP
jgi:Mg-chelatase subunit ChlD